MDPLVLHWPRPHVPQAKLKRATEDSDRMKQDRYTAWKTATRPQQALGGIHLGRRIRIKWRRRARVVRNRLIAGVGTWTMERYTPRRMPSHSSNASRRSLLLRAMSFEPDLMGIDDD